MKKRHEQKLVLLSLGLILVFNIPFVLVLNGDETVLGFPVFYLSVFAIWFLSILISYYILKRFYE